MNWKNVKLGDVCDVIAGQSPPSSTYNDNKKGLPFYQGKADFGEIYPKVRMWCDEPNKIAEPNDILLSVRAPVGPTNICDATSCIGRGLAAIRGNGKTDHKFVYYYFKFIEPILSTKGSGSTFSAITIGDVKNLEFPIAPIPTQQRIATILDKADELYKKDQQLLAKYDELLQSIFYDMFGNPVKNEMDWVVENIRKASLKFSDGPFGSHLKSEHYVDDGIRIIRLQNIGTNEFIDDNKAFISEAHYETIKKHSCYPGDILIGTLGEPNLRACILPDNIPVAINKADCILISPDKRTVSTEYLCQLINSTEFVKSASNLILGQTRGRISMGRLSTTSIPLPPIRLQNQFAAIAQNIQLQKQQVKNQIKQSENLFQGLLQRAFKGEL